MNYIYCIYNYHYAYHKTDPMQAQTLYWSLPPSPRDLPDNRLGKTRGGTPPDMRFRGKSELRHQIGRYAGDVSDAGSEFRLEPVGWVEEQVILPPQLQLGFRLPRSESATKELAAVEQWA